MAGHMPFVVASPRSSSESPRQKGGSVPTHDWAFFRFYDTTNVLSVAKELSEIKISDFTSLFDPRFFFDPQILALSPLKESQQRRNQDHSKALALEIEIDMPFALVEPREVYPREKSIFVHVSLTGSCTGFQLTCCALLGTVKC